MKVRHECTNPFVPGLRLFHSWPKMRAWCERHGIEDAARTPGLMCYVDGVAAIYVEDCGSARDTDALIVHESYHAAITHLSAIGEDEPGEETVAYCVQSVARSVMEAHDGWKRGRRS